MSQVYGQTGANDTPVLVPGWTVQTGGTNPTGDTNGGSNQALTGSAGPSGALVQQQTAPAHVTTGVVADVQTGLNGLIDTLKTAGVLK